MLLVVELILLAGTLGIIAWPLYSHRLTSGATLVDNKMSSLLYKKEVAYAALTDLKFDYETGKLDDADFKQMQAQFESEAIDVMQAIDEEQEAVSSMAPSVSTGGSFCPHCGQSVEGHHKFCASCGESL